MTSSIVAKKDTCSGSPPGPPHLGRPDAQVGAQAVRDVRGPAVRRRRRRRVWAVVVPAEQHPSRDLGGADGVHHLPLAAVRRSGDEAVLG
ncbi:hypothetical protein PG997_001967 [Apiospora hydei]|uniref:Uncharacterized protein n=1 Tax=Apiospora hydei TaxID=1337664 RepID=A0ABR1X7Z9_9PEZI